MIQTKKDKDQKEVIRMIKRSDELWRAKMSVPLVKLDKPYQQGWIRYFKLRKDIAKSPQGKILQRLLDKYLQNPIYCMRKDFTYKNYRTGKMIPLTQIFRDISKKEFENLLPDEKKYFEEYTKHLYAAVFGTAYRCVIERWKFDFVVKPFMIGYKRALIPEIESELKILSDKIWDSKAYHHYVKRNNSNKWYFSDHHQLMNFKYGEYLDKEVFDLFVEKNI